MTTEVYELTGVRDFAFPHAVRYPNQLTLELSPGGVVPPSEYTVIGYGPSATGVTVRYPNAPASETIELRITRYTQPERVATFPDDRGVTARALNAEFDNVYQAVQDFSAQLEDRVDAIVEVEVPIKVDEYLDEYLPSYADDFLDAYLPPKVDAEVQPYVDQAEGARDSAESARDVATAAAGDAEQAMVQAGVYADNAANDASIAQSARDDTTSARDEAVQALVDLNGIYYGAASTDPTVDPNGDPPDVGDMYWNTTGSGALRIFNGTVWVPLPDGYLTEADLARNGGTIPETNSENVWDAPQRFEGPMQDHLVFQRMGDGDEFSIGMGTVGGSNLSLGPVGLPQQDRVRIEANGRLNATEIYDNGQRVGEIRAVIGGDGDTLHVSNSLSSSFYSETRPGYPHEYEIYHNLGTENYIPQIFVMGKFGQTRMIVPSMYSLTPNLISLTVKELEVSVTIPDGVALRNLTTQRIYIRIVLV